MYYYKIALGHYSAKIHITVWVMNSLLVKAEIFQIPLSVQTEQYPFHCDFI